MKKYIMTISAITFFLGSQIVSMDRPSHNEDISALKDFLLSNLAIEQAHILYYRNGNIPTLQTAILLNWTRQMRDIVENDRIRPETARNLFVSLAKEAIIQNLSSHYPNETAKNIHDFYNRAYSQQIERLAHTIFKKLR
jgi:hypothetical protein